MSRKHTFIHLSNALPWLQSSLLVLTGGSNAAAVHAAVSLSECLYQNDTGPQASPLPNAVHLAGRT